MERNAELIAFELNVRQVCVTGTPAAAQTGWHTVERDGTAVAIDTQLTDGLVREGLARDFVRQIQNLRKGSSYSVDDHVRIEYRSSGPLRAAVEEHRGYLTQETLADSLTVSDDEMMTRVRIAGEEVGLRLSKV